MNVSRRLDYGQREYENVRGHLSRDFGSHGSLVGEQSKPTVSIVDRQTVITAFTVAVLFHVVALILGWDNVLVTLPEFWLFLGSDVALWTLGLLPLLAAWRGRLTWHDPFFWLSLLCFIIGNVAL